MKFTRSALGSAAVAVASLVASAASHAGVIYFDYNKNLNLSNNASVFLFGAAGQTATVSNLAGFSQNVVLDGAGFFNLGIPNTFQQSGTGVVNSGFKVESSNAIAGYFINRATATTDMTYLLDSSALGTNYVVASAGVGFGEGSQIAVHATVDNTNVTINRKGGAAINVTLNAGQTYKYAGGSVDQTGASIVADKAVAVFSGHECAQVPGGTTFCDTLLEQAIPTDKLSKNYQLTASKGAALAVSRSDLVRVIATANNTEVKVNGAVVATLNAGQFHEFQLGQNTGATVEASAAVAVAQYLTGGGGRDTDPAMSYVPGADTWLKQYRLATPAGAAAFDVNYASVVVDSSALASLRLNGAAVNTSGFSAIGTTGFSRGIIDLPIGLFDLTGDLPFLVMLGGGSAADSYFTYGGSTFAPGVSPPPPPTDVPEPGTLALGALAAALAVGARRRQQKAASQA
jgi:MYXO-CTERM domain-containing protein